MDLTLEEFLNIFTVSDPSGGRKLKVTTTGGLDDAESVLTISDPAGGRFIKVELTGGGGGGGNANITSINVAALQALQTGSTLSTTTFYNVTNAVGSTRVLQVYAIANNTNVVAAIDLETGEIGTYNITDDVFVNTNGARKDADGNTFIGNDNDTNTLATSTGNLFLLGAGVNDLTGSSTNNFGINSSSNVLVDSNYNYFSDNAQSISLNTAIYNIFGNGVSNLDSVNNEFSYCTVAESLNFSTIDFTNAAQLFGRSDRWSINKILGTDLIEVTFDANLATAQTGQYDTNTDTFTPYASTYTPTITPDGAVASNGVQITDWVYLFDDKVLTISGTIRSDCDFSAGEDATFTFDYPLGVTLSTSTGSGSCYGQTTDPAAPLSVTESDGTLTVKCRDNTYTQRLYIYFTTQILIS